MVMPTILLQAPLNVGGEIQQFTQTEFFAFTIPFLLAFAIVYGLLSHAEVPKSSNSRAVLSLIISLLTLPVAPALTGFLRPLASSLLILIGGLLIFIILIELLDIKTKTEGYTEGEEGRKRVESNLFTKHGTGFAGVLIILALVIFVNAGGLELIGIQTPGLFLNAPLLFFLTVILLVVWFISATE